MFNNIEDYYRFQELYKTDYINYNNTEGNYEKYSGKTQGIFQSIFSPNINNINVLELSSLNNGINLNSQNRIKVNKLVQPSNKDVIILNSGKKALILDLDETLVHSSTQSPFPNQKNIILDMNTNNIKYKIYVIIRPFFEKFLYEMSLCYDLYVFTASRPLYSKSLIEILDKNKVIIQVLNREHCLNIQGTSLKDLSIFNKDLKDIIIIDNNPVSYSLNKNNGIPILTWIDNPNDQELLKLIPILKYLSKVKDVRPIINKIVNKSKNKIDYIKVNEILKNNDNNLNHLKKHDTTKSTDVLNDFNEKLIESSKIIKNDEINNNDKENNTLKSQSIEVNNMKNIIKNNNDINKSRIDKLNIIRKLRINKTKSFSFKNQRNPIDNIISKESKKENNIYNITIENINNVQNKINIFNTMDINKNEKEPMNSNKKAKLSTNEINKKNNINNNTIAVNMHKISNINKLRKNLINNKYKIIRKALDLNKVKFKTIKNISIKKDETDKSPIDNAKTKIEKKTLKLSIKTENLLVNNRNFNTFQTEIEDTNVNQNNLTVTEGDKEISNLYSIHKKNTIFNFTKKIRKNKPLSRLDEDIKPIKKDKIVVMKIIKNPNKKKESANLINNNYLNLI